MFQLHEAYDAVFAAIKLKVKFNIVEIAEMSPEWVFARTTSEGTTLNHATGTTSKRRIGRFSSFTEEGKFKIARYSFLTTTP